MCQGTGSKCCTELIQECFVNEEILQKRHHLIYHLREFFNQSTSSSALHKISSVPLVHLICLIVPFLKPLLYLLTGRNQNVLDFYKTRFLFCLSSLQIQECSLCRRKEYSCTSGRYEMHLRKCINTTSSKSTRIFLSFYYFLHFKYMLSLFQKNILMVF